MLSARVIPCLLLHDNALVKSRRYGRLDYVGDPVNVVRIFNELEVDELIFLDILASQDGREPPYELLEQLASECFMPFTYGGGIRSLDIARRVFGIGVEKAAVNSAALRNPGLITDIASAFGSQSVVISIDVKRSRWRGARVASNRARKLTQYEPLAWARRAEELGAGELLLTAIDRDGTWAGLDLELVRHVAGAVRIPVIAHGGVGSFGDIADGVNQGGASGIGVGSLFVYQKKGMGVLVHYPTRSQLDAALGA